MRSVIFRRSVYPCEMDKIILIENTIPMAPTVPCLWHFANEDCIGGTISKQDVAEYIWQSPLREDV